MENETEVIRQQMFDTRSALTDKLEALEVQVAAKVKDTTDSVAETVESVKDAVQDTVQTVSNTVDRTVESVKETFDLSRHFEEHPYVVLGGAVLAGFIGGRLLDRLAPPPATNGFHHEPRQETGQTHFQLPPPSSSEPGKGSEMVEALRPAMSKLRQLAIGVTTGLIAEMVSKSIPEGLHHEVDEVIDDITLALGGKPIHCFGPQE
jgi:ElaB/YqjD/DUF883 family membrane-anchored ribosome-binding protein